MVNPLKKRLPPPLAIIRRDWKNPPNLVTGARMIGALWLPSLITSPSLAKRRGGLVLFSVLAVTDHLDGWMAKHRYGATDLGKVLDPIADKELILLTLTSAIIEARRRGDTQLVKSLLATTAVISAREATVACVNLHAQNRDGRVESAIQSSRVSMATEAVALGALLVPVNSPLARRIKIALLAVSAATSVYSGWDYYRTYRSPSS